MKKLTAWILCICLVFGTAGMSFAAPGDRAIGIKTKGERTLPSLLGGTQVTAGDMVLFLVNRDNFLWEPGDGSGAQWTETAVEELGLVAWCGETPYVHPPRLIVREGELYIAMEAAQPTEGVLLQVAVRSLDNRSGPIGQAMLAIAPKDSGGEGPPEPGGGEGPGEEEGPGGGDGPGDGGGSGGENGSGNGEKPGNGDGGNNPDPNEGGKDPGGGDSGSGDGNNEKERPDTTSGLTIAGLNTQYSLQQAIDHILVGGGALLPGESLWIPLPAKVFLWEDSKGAEVEPADYAAVQMSALQKAGVAAGFDLSTGDSVIKSAQTKEINGAVGIYITLESGVLSLENVPFLLTAYLNWNGTVAAEAKIAGWMEIQPVTIYGGATVDLQDGTIAQAGEELNQANLYLGNGVTLRTSLKAGQRCAGLALDDGEFFSLYTLGVQAEDCQVYIDTNLAVHLYSEGGTYLGPAGSWLGYYSIYQKGSAPPVTVGGPGSGKSTSSIAGDRRDPIPGTPERFYEEQDIALKLEEKSAVIAGGNINDNPSTGGKKIFLLQVQ